MPLAKLIGNRLPSGSLAIPSLKSLTQSVLGYDIQNGEHSSVDDARATMKIFQKYQEDWLEYEPMIRKNKKNLKEPPPVGHTVFGAKSKSLTYSNYYYFLFNFQ